MPETELRRLLGELESTVEAMDEDNAPLRDRLTQLSSAVETHLGAHEKAETEPLIEQITSTIHEFESEHPSATTLLNHIASTLGSMGI